MAYACAHRQTHGRLQTTQRAEATEGESVAGKEAVARVVAEFADHVH